MFLLPLLWLSAAMPTAVFLLPVVLPRSEPPPVAGLSPPGVLLKRALTPLAVLVLPVVLLEGTLKPMPSFLGPARSSSAPLPVAVLLKPVELLLRAEAPVAVFWLPLVRFTSTFDPNAVLPTPENVPLKRSLGSPPAVLPLKSKNIAPVSPQLGVTDSSRASPATTETKRANGFMASPCAG